jgi:tetratricopeptide (TPR) repeat protein
MIRKLLTTTALASVLLIAPSCSKSPQDGTVQRKATTAAALPVPGATAHAPADRAELLQEAVSALQETDNALTAIDQKKQKEATAALERATGKLEILLARTPTLALAPVDATAITYDVLGDAKDVEALRGAAERAIEETVVSVSSLPLATYPAAIKSAAALLAQGKMQDAKAVLQTALNTVVVHDTIIPLPIARAEAAIDQAKSLSEKANRTDADNARLHTLLTTARGQLRFGKALGYATDKDMDDLLRALDEIEDKTSGQKHGVGLLDRIKGMFDHARESSQAPERKR